MQLKAMLTDDDAVSPVIGVILMVAITVILAAVIASFVLGLGPGEATPTASFDFEYDENAGSNGAIEVTHSTGAKIDPGQVSVQFESPGGDTHTVGYESSNDDINTGSQTAMRSMGGSQVGSGDTVALGGDSGSSLSPGDWEVSVVYDGGDQTASLDDATVSVP